MNHLSLLRRRRLGGVSAKGIALPLAFVIALLQVAIIVLIIVANTRNATLSSTINDYSKYESDASSLVAGASVLNGTATGYVAAPTVLGPLYQYSAELNEHPGLERRPAAVAARFADADVGADAKEHLQTAKEAAEHMITIQLKAISLALFTQPNRETPRLKELNDALPALSAEETALSDAELQQRAKDILNAPDYSELMGIVSSNVTGCVNALREESGKAVSHLTSTIKSIRLALLVTTAVYSVLLLSTFLVLYLWMVSPLDRFVRGIAADLPLNENKGLYEVRRLANSYNALLRRRESLETVLRFAAETDPLTGLPNRSRFEQYFYESGKTGDSLAFLVFDVNRLKEINDRKGHLAGDELIRHSAECIGECFGVPGESNCFRIGGDEFAAIVRRSPRSDIDRRVEWFNERQKQMDISVAVGLAYVDKVGDTTFRDLFLAADRDMYSDKMRAHSEKRAAGA